MSHDWVIAFIIVGVSACISVTSAVSAYARYKYSGGREVTHEREKP